MTPTIIKTETETVIVIPRDTEPSSTSTHSMTGGNYSWRGSIHKIPEEVTTAAFLWARGKTSAEIAEGCKLKVKGRNAFDSDTGQRLLGAIRRVLPELLPPRTTPQRRHQ